RGEESGANHVYHRFARRRYALAQARLNSAVRDKVGPEDVVQSAFRSFFSLVRRSEEDDQLFDVRNWDGLWAVLGVIAVRKCRRQWRLFHGAGRDVGREQKLAPATGDSGSGWEAVTRQPLPEEAAALGDLVEQMLGRLVLRDRPILETRLKGTVSRKSSPRRV